MRVWRAAVLAFAVAMLVEVGAVRADLKDSSERLAQAWRSSGALVVVDRTRFLNENESIAVLFPSLPPAPCTTVVFLGARGLGFHARVVDAGDEEPGRKVPSEAGAVAVERCGGARPRRAVLSSDSGRGAVETIVAVSDEPLWPLRMVLPERTGGAAAPGPEPGALPLLPSPENRAEVVESRARLDGAVIARRVTWQAGLDGSGAGLATLEPGCHRLRLLAPDLRSLRVVGQSRVDIDAEMRDEADDRLMARDRSDAPDAELAACVGEPTRVEVVFAGSPPNLPVLVTHCEWSLPKGLPTLWGSQARARMAKALLTHHVPSLPRDPFLLVQGGSGATPVPVSIEPGGCYLAVVSVVQGMARALALRVRLGGGDVFDDRGIDESGAAVAFCAQEHERALLHVEVRGAPPLGWGLAVYRLEDDVWEGSR